MIMKRRTLHTWQNILAFRGHAAVAGGGGAGGALCGSGGGSRDGGGPPCRGTQSTGRSAMQVHVPRVGLTFALSGPLLTRLMEVFADLI